jgi:hypothetical protein
VEIPQLHKSRTIWFVALIILISACTGAEQGDNALPPGATSPALSQPQNTPGIPGEEIVKETTGAGDLSSPKVQPDLLPNEPPPLGAENQFNTDFNKHTVPYQEILSGGPPKDGIPAIDNPAFIGVDEANADLEDIEPVVFFQIGNDARAYPLQILTWHEIVNDVVDGKPVAVTFCPLCNTAIAFDATFDDQVLDFGTTGRLRFSNLIMYDRQTETWWQQATGEGLAGKYAGEQLTFLPASIISWKEFKTNFPDGKVLSKDTGFRRDYGRNPYAGYDNITNSPFLFRGPETPGVLPAMARVLTVDIDGEAVAFPYEILQQENVINDIVSGHEVAVFWQPGVASALDSSRLAAGQDIGTGVAFSRTIDQQVLTFSFLDGKIIDDQTSSEWDVFGTATSGQLAGSKLEPIVSVNHFWFSWAAFKPETRIYQP